MRLSTSCASWKWDFRFAQVRLSCGNPSNLGCSLGKLFSTRRERYATATRHSSEMASLDRITFRCSSSQRMINFGTRRSSTHQDNIPCWTPITSIVSLPVLVAPRWLRISRGVTCLKRVVSYFWQITHVSSMRERMNFFPTRSAVRMAAW